MLVLRLGWNVSPGTVDANRSCAGILTNDGILQIVTGYLDSAARNLGHTEQPEVCLLMVLSPSGS